MRLIAKLVFIMMTVFIIILGIDGYISVQREVELFENDMKRDALLLGRTMKGLVVETWKSTGKQKALELIENSNLQEHRIRIRWVWFDVSSNDSFGPSIERARLEAVSQGQEASFKEKILGSDEVLHTYIPVKVNSGRSGAIELSESLFERNQYNRRTILQISILTGVLILGCGIMTIWLGIRLVGSPLHHLNKHAQQVGQGDFSGRLSLRGRDELSELANTFNLMSDNLLEAQEQLRHEMEARISTLKQLRHADRLTTVGSLASGIAHELGTPLNVVDGRAGLIVKGKLPATDVIESAKIIRTQTKRMTKIIQELLKFARQGVSVKKKLELRQLVEETINFLQPIGHKQNTTVTYVGEEVVFPVVADAGQMQQVVVNLIINGLQAMSQGGKLEVGICYEHAQPPSEHGGSGREYLCFYVQDEGEGISEEVKTHIFDPFFTTKEIGEGTGLGLSIVHGIIQEHGGWIEVSSKPGKGSRFSIYLPEENEV